MPKILIVDDDQMTRGFLRRALKDTYTTVETGNPEEALALALEEKPDAILLDLMMPNFSGIELCQTLHSLSYTSTIPIFVVSGEAGAKYGQDCEKLGAKRYFQKRWSFSLPKLF
jgi:CheY-like chemotaxis protein